MAPEPMAAEPGPTPDEAAEAAAVADIRSRGESAIASIPQAEPAEEEPKGQLPDIESLVSRIDPSVRGTLEELYRVRFTRTIRVPAKKLTGA